jgi:hypothetical protein
MFDNFWKPYFNEAKCILNKNHKVKIYLFINYNDQYQIIPALEYDTKKDINLEIIKTNNEYKNFSLEAFIHTTEKYNDYFKNLLIKYKVTFNNKKLEKIFYKFYLNYEWYQYYLKNTNNRNMLNLGLKYLNEKGFYDNEEFIPFNECIPLLTKNNFKILQNNLNK